MYLLPDRADVHVQDADGWTALHNACSKVISIYAVWYPFIRDVKQGYLDIVRWLCEDGDATSECDGFHGVDVRSKGGWTPLSTIVHFSHIAPFIH
jgi:ankyrin repeat protein